MAAFISDWALLAGLEGVELPHLITLVNELLCDLKPITRHIREHIKKRQPVARYEGFRFLSYKYLISVFPVCSMRSCSECAGPSGCWSGGNWSCHSWALAWDQAGGQGVEESGSTV